MLQPTTLSEEEKLERLRAAVREDEERRRERNQRSAEAMRRRRENDEVRIRERARDAEAKRRRRADEKLRRIVVYGANHDRGVFSNHSAISDLSRLQTKNQNGNIIDNTYLTEEEETPETSKKTSEFDLFGNSVAAQLKTLPLVNAIEVQLQIQQLITRQRLDVLLRPTQTDVQYDKHLETQGEEVVHEDPVPTHIEEIKIKEEYDVEEMEEIT